MKLLGSLVPQAEIFFGGAPKDSNEDKTFAPEKGGMNAGGKRITQMKRFDPTKTETHKFKTEKLDKEKKQLESEKLEILKKKKTIVPSQTDARIEEN